MREAAYVVMGVSGCGKSTIGRALAARLGHAFADGDDLHPLSNIAKMAKGDPLTDADRLPWLAAVAASLRPGTVVACSALRRSYRDLLRDGAPAPVVLIHLRGERTTLLKRMTVRAGHFMPVALLDSQLQTLEAPTADEQCISVDIGMTEKAMVDQIVTALSVDRDGARA